MILPSVELYIADSESNTQYKMSDVITNAEYYTTLLPQPGKLAFTVIDLTEKQFCEGSNVVLAVDGKKIFDGYLFTRTRTEKDTMQCVAYDRLRYLSNKDTKIFVNKTPEDIFTEVCGQLGLTSKVVSGSGYTLPPVVYDNKSYYQMVTEALENSLVANGKYLILRDNVGTVEMVDVATLTTNVLIGDAKLLTGFQFESSIDKNTFNVIKLVQENKKEKARNAYITKDSETIRKWGQLQYFKKVDNDASAAQIETMGSQMLRLYNRKTRTLQVTCFGDLQIRAGSGVDLQISKLSNEGIANSQTVFVSECTHTFTKEHHTMSLNLEVV